MDFNNRVKQNFTCTTVRNRLKSYRTWKSSKRLNRGPLRSFDLTSPQKSIKKKGNLNNDEIIVKKENSEVKIKKESDNYILDDIICVNVKSPYDLREDNMMKFCLEERKGKEKEKNSYLDRDDNVKSRLAKEIDCNTEDGTTMYDSYDSQSEEESLKLLFPGI
jgi:hypothetical protein